MNSCTFSGYGFPLVGLGGGGVGTRRLHVRHEGCGRSGVEALVLVLGVQKAATLALSDSFSTFPATSSATWCRCRSWCGCRACSPAGSATTVVCGTACAGTVVVTIALWAVAVLVTATTFALAFTLALPLAFAFALAMLVFAEAGGEGGTLVFLNEFAEGRVVALALRIHGFSVVQLL